MTRRSNILPRPAGAFTLIEVLITIAMVSILLAALQTTLFSALRLRETTNDIFEAELPRHMIIALMKRDLADIVPPPSLPPEPEEGADQQQEGQLTHEAATGRRLLVGGPALGGAFGRGRLRPLTQRGAVGDLKRDGGEGQQDLLHGSARLARGGSSRAG